MRDPTASAPITPLVFIQRSWLGRRIYELRPDRLTVTERPLRLMFVQEISLSTLDPDYRREAAYASSIVLIVLGATILGIMAIIFTLLTTSLPPIFVTVPLGFLLPLMLGLLPALQKVDVWTFNNHWGKPVLALVRDPAQGAEFDDFIHAILDAVDGTSPVTPTGSLTPPPIASAVILATPEDEEERARPKNYWRASLIAGAISALFPWLSVALPSLAFFDLGVVFFGSSIGLWRCVTSYLATEPRRHWSLAGAALALIAPLFY